MRNITTAAALAAALLLTGCMQTRWFAAKDNYARCVAAGSSQEACQRAYNLEMTR